MKSIMYKLITILLAVMSFAAARSLPNNYMSSNQESTGGLARGAVDSTSKTDNAERNFMAEISNLSMPSYLKDLFINLTHSSKADDLSDSMKVNTIRSYENVAKSKLHLKYIYIYLRNAKKKSIKVSMSNM